MIGFRTQDLGCVVNAERKGASAVEKNLSVNPGLPVDVPTALLAIGDSWTRAADLSFWVPITPKPKGRPRLGLGRVFTPQITRDYERQVSLYLKTKYRDRPLDGPLDIRMGFYLLRPKSVSEKKRLHPDVKPDIDNFSKAVLDAANGILFQDDCQVVVAYAEKRYSKAQGTWIEIRRLGVTL